MFASLWSSFSFLDHICRHLYWPPLVRLRSGRYHGCNSYTLPSTLRCALRAMVYRCLIVPCHLFHYTASQFERHSHSFLFWRGTYGWNCVPTLSPAEIHACYAYDLVNLHKRKRHSRMLTPLTVQWRGWAEWCERGKYLSLINRVMYWDLTQIYVFVPGRSSLELVVRKHNETKISLALDPTARSAQLAVKEAYWHCLVEGFLVSSTYATA